VNEHSLISSSASRCLTIGLDASRAARAHRTGTETYSLELIKALAQLASPQRHLRLYTPHPPQHTDWPDLPYVETRIIPWPRLWTHLRLSVELRLHPPEVLFVPAHVLPLSCPVPAVITVHDLGYLHYPHAHHRFDRWYLDWTTRRHTRVAHHLIADSQATKNDLIDFYGAKPDQITVVYLGRDEPLARVGDPQSIEATKSKYHVVGDYLLYLGTLQPRKNLIRLVEAFHQAVTSLQNDGLKLVIAGRQGWLYTDIFERVQHLSLTGRVLFPGYIADADKPALLSGALAYVFPSLYEGFGLPVLEAMACGTPVLTSNCSSLPEVAGRAALLVDPHDTPQIANGLVQLIINPDLRGQLVERGYCQIQQFSWSKAAKQVMEILEGVASNQKSVVSSQEKKVYSRYSRSQTKFGNEKIPMSFPQDPSSSPEFPQFPLPPTVTILGLKIHALTNAQTLELIEAFIASRQPHQLATVNPEFVVAAQEDEEFQQIINNASLALPDGIGLLKAARFLGTTPLPERVAGSDLVVKLADLSHRKGYRIYFLGAQPGVAEKAIERLKARYPNLQVAGCYAGSPSLEENEAIVQCILPTRPDILLVAYGAPRQDKWIARNLDRLQIPVCIGVGGSFDFIAGTAERAPMWVQRLGLEWFHRLLTQPWRWRRIWNAVPRFSWLVFWSRFARK
jgi:exopolysaccharide biosynthesis WecB/TagA/CpsF family protein